jgi:serine/threonine protein kinase
MTLAAGTRLGPYDVLSQVGAGGMGEVYRAKDTKLGRDVALKILPASFTNDPERVARFRREAQVLASLNHPHIAQIYGLEEANGTQFLVLELVDGESLDKRIARGPIPVDEALGVARQIAEALEAAHEKGIIHRDLKPANIALTNDGSVKVLDFGLAKAVETTSGSVDAMNSPTITSPAMMTRVGVLLGTAAYMSPEQAKGRPADKRSDIWAFGCVLFEMLTGKRAFGGEDLSDTLAFILTKDPEWTLLPPETPSSIRRLLRRCLEKQRARRLADIADARIDLDEADSLAAASAATSVPQSARSITPRSALLGAAIGAVVVATLWLGVSAIRDRSVVNSDVSRASILLPSRLSRNPYGAPVALSPDGRRIALVASDTTGRNQLWLRSLDSLTARPIADTEGASTPFWSPDSRWVAFVANGKLKKIDASGGTAVTLCESALAGGTWSRDDILLFTQTTTRSLAQVRGTGGVAARVTTIDANAHETGHVSPVLLPDGRHFVYVAQDEALSQAGSVYVGAVDSRQKTRLPVEAASVQYAQGFLWFVRGTTLMAQPFDAGRRTIVGEAVPVAEQLRIEGFSGGFFSVSPAGALVFQPDPSSGYELTWFDREGRPIGTLGPPGDYDDLRLSPDGRRLLVSLPSAGMPNRDLWIIDVSRGLRSRFTFGDASSRGAIWSPDGSRIVFSAQRGGHMALVEKASNGAGAEKVLFDDEFEKELSSWSRDGRFILYQRRNGNQPPTPWVLPMDGDRKTFPLSPTRAFFPQISPDGRWIAYMSLESGRPEVYVAPFPGPGGRWQISTTGGIDPLWRADGREIFYLSPEGLTSAAVTVDRDHVEVGEVKLLFALRKIGRRLVRDVSPDGERILAVTEKAQGGTEPLTLLVNWPALLKK